MLKCGIFICLSLLMLPNMMYGQDITIVSKRLETRIVIPAQADVSTSKAASILQDYIKRATGITLIIDSVKERRRSYFYLELQPGLSGIKGASLQDGGFGLSQQGNDLQFFCGDDTKAMLQAVYYFIDKFIGAKKWDEGSATVPQLKEIRVPKGYNTLQSPSFDYREVYLPAAFDGEYRNWYGLQQFEALWGLWGHSFFKLVPPRQYFESHPEYFALVNGERKATQLCLANPDVLQITLRYLDSAFKENPSAKYWSIAANDGGEFCECDSCSKQNELDGGVQGSLITFVNKVAAHFPAKQFTTLAYLETKHAPLHTKPAPNVHIMLSSIDAYRTFSLEKDPSAAGFRRDLTAWLHLTPHVMVWDYCTQFTNYLTPFLSVKTTAENIAYLKSCGVEGIFEQGSGDTYSDLAALKAYVTANKLWNTDAPTDDLIATFLEHYYGKAASAVSSYLQLLEESVLQTNTRLDIYGNPVNDHDGYLSPFYIDQFSSILDRAEGAVETKPVLLKRVKALRLSQEYVVLQQSKFYHNRDHGIFIKRNNQWEVKPQWPQRLEYFEKVAKATGVSEIAEAGQTLTAYMEEWQSILDAGVRLNKAKGATVHYQFPPDENFPANGYETLVDETPGYADFSYNWQCFYGDPMIVDIDLGKVTAVDTISTRFLQDPRHWIFPPGHVNIFISKDGHNFEKVFGNDLPRVEEEDYKVQFRGLSIPVHLEIKAIRIEARPIPSLPSWRYKPGRKVMMACDEVWVQ